MLVENRMTKEPITVESVDLLIRASRKMQAGGFRRLPVVADGKLVGIITERDLREHRGHLEHTKINGVMTNNPLTVTPGTTLERAAQVMLERQIGGLPVLDEGRLVGNRLRSRGRRTWTHRSLADYRPRRRRGFGRRHLQRKTG